MEESMVELGEMVERLGVAAAELESAVVVMGAWQDGLVASAAMNAGRIVATVESAREAELEEKLVEAEAKIVALEASVASSSLGGRKTAMVAKNIAAGVDANAIDAALVGLTVEQRIAVKSELMRSGLI